jgi:hypothetical protein
MLGTTDVPVQSVVMYSLFRKLVEYSAPDTRSCWGGHNWINGQCYSLILLGVHD